LIKKQKTRTECGFFRISKQSDWF